MERVPPPGPDLDFEQWVHRVVEGVRKRVPTVVATRRGRSVIVRRGSEAVTIESGATSWFVWKEGPQRRVLLSISARRDAFVADTAAVTIAVSLGD